MAYGAAPVSLRDLLVSFAELNPANHETRRALLDLLGLTSHSRGPTPLRAPGTAAAMTEDPLPPRLEWRALPPASHQPEAELPAPPFLTTLTTAAKRPPLRWPSSQGQEPIAGSRHAGKAPPPPSIFAPLASRAIYTAALSTRVHEGDLDLEQTVAQLGEGRPLNAIPRLPLRTLRRGVQLLLDQGPNMAPFMHDVQGLATALKQLLSDSQLEVLFFSGCPTRGLRESPRLGRRRRFRPPARGVPVLVASDFGLANTTLAEEGVSLAEWLRFTQLVRGEGHHLVGLAPFPPNRWPRALSERMAFVQWSEHTSAAEVHRSLRRAERRLQ